MLHGQSKRNVTLISSVGPGLSASWLCLAIHPQSRGLNWLCRGDPGQDLLLKVLKPEGTVSSPKAPERMLGEKGGAAWRLVLLGFGQLDRGARRQTFLILICVCSPAPHPRWLSSCPSSAVYTILPHPQPLLVTFLICGQFCRTCSQMTKSVRT